MLSLYILTSVLVVVLIHSIRRFMKWRAHYNNMPGETDFSWIHGTLHKYPGFDEEGMMSEMRMMEKHKYFHRHWFGPINPVMSLYHPEVIRKVLKSSAPKPYYQVTTSSYQMLKPFLGEGLIVASGTHWAKHRRLLTPAFHFEALKSYTKVYNDCTDVLLTKIQAMCDKEEMFDLYPMLTQNALDIILRSAFSYVSNCQTNQEKSEYLTSLHEVVNLLNKRMFNALHSLDFIYNLSQDGKQMKKHCNVVHQVSMDVIEQRIKHLEKNGVDAGKGKVRDFLDTLLLTRDENGQSLSSAEINDEVVSFMFAGHDTTKSATTFTLHHLSQHPEYQQRVYEEICEVLGDRDEVHPNDLPKLTYTTMCIKEAMRKSSTVTNIGRQLSEDVKVNGYTIPKGTEVNLEFHLLHHNPLLWENPHVYDPERFNPERQKHMDPFQFVPFSAGSRNCIGQHFAMNEMKVVIVKILKRFELQADPEYKVRMVNVGIMTPEEGVRVLARARN